MTDPQPVPQRRAPPRAESLQPDKPGQGDKREGGDELGDPAERKRHDPSAEKLRDQSQDALKNVSTGYD